MLIFKKILWIKYVRSSCLLYACNFIKKKLRYWCTALFRNSFPVEHISTVASEQPNYNNMNLNWILIYLAYANNSIQHWKEYSEDYLLKHILLIPFQIKLIISWYVFGWQSPDGIYLFKANNRNTKTLCEICSKIT